MQIRVLLLVLTLGYSAWGARINIHKRQGADGSESCHEKLMRLKAEETKSGPVPDREFPTCDQYGNYEARQCYARWTSSAHCSCVDPLTGDKLKDITGEPYRSLEGAAMTCRCALDYPLETERKEYCDTNTGDYPAVVCIGEKCMCAERWGAPMYGFRVFNRGESNCLCARKTSDIRGLVGTSYNCDPYGRFERVQCMGSQCYCVDVQGEPVGQTVFIANAGKLQCK